MSFEQMTAENFLIPAEVTNRDLPSTCHNDRSAKVHLKLLYVDATNLIICKLKFQRVGTSFCRRTFFNFSLMLMLMLIFVTRLNSRSSRSADIYYGQSKLRWYRCVLSCDRNEPTLEAVQIIARRLFQTLCAAIEKCRDAVLFLECGTDSMSRDDEGRFRVGL